MVSVSDINLRSGPLNGSSCQGCSLRRPSAVLVNCRNSRGIRAVPRSVPSAWNSSHNPLKTSHADVADEIKKIIFAYNSRLTSEERSLLSVAYKNLTNTLRNSWRSVNGLATAAATVATIDPKRLRELNLIQQHKRKIEDELVDTCKEIIGLLDRYLLVAAKPGEESVFYSKM
jgi:14-3-3 protein